MKKSPQIAAKGKGKTFSRSVLAAKKRVRDSNEYFIQRNGAWFRPEARGYTDELSQAGVFVGARAKGYLNVEGVVLVPVVSFLPRLTKLMRDHINSAAKLAHMIESY